MTSPAISRHSSPAPEDRRGRAGRNESPRRPSRPNLQRRDSSPMARMATLGLLATSGVGQALGAPVHSRDVSPSPHRQLSRIEQDMRQAMELVRRGEDPYANVDWDKVDYSHTDYSQIDWTKVDYGSNSRPDSPSVYSTPPAMPSPTLSSLGRAYEQTFGQPSPLATPPVPTSLVRGFSPSLPPIMTATPVPNAPKAPPAPLLAVPPAGNQAPFLAPSATSQQPVATPAATHAAGNTAQGGNAASYFDGVDAAQNTVAVKWHGDEAMTFSFFANAGPYQPNLSEAYKSVTLQPGGSAHVELPYGWSGRVQKMTGAVNSPATWCEVTFDGYMSETWFDVSSIRGYNGPVEMSLASTPQQIAGNREDRRKAFPRDQLLTQARGEAIPATEGYDGSIRFDIIDFWRAHNHDTAAHKEAYIVHDDDSATMTGSSKHLLTEWF